MDAYKEEVLQGVAFFLVNDKLLDQTNAALYQQLAAKNSLNLPQYLVQQQILSSREIALSIARHFKLMFIDLNTLNKTAIPLHLIPTVFLERNRVLPLYIKNNTLHVAIDDPNGLLAIKELHFLSGITIAPCIVETDQLDEHRTALLNSNEHQLIADYFKTTTPQNEANNDVRDDAPIIKFVNRVLNEAILKNASDIHFESYEVDYRIRYRIDGILQEIANPPLAIAARIAARIKIMSQLNIAERQVPQNGRLQIKTHKNQTIDFRVSTCPTLTGEKIVVRLLDSKVTDYQINTLGFSTLQKKHFLNAINRPQGLVLVTGPTGSGKTVTLYSALTYLNTPERNISTIEDPVEIKINGINQVNINLNIGFNFSDALRTFLRQDPDIIMIGEIRDLETAEIALKAAQTGHLVLSTLHTNSAAEALTRLIHIGIPLYNIAYSISLIIAQRLLRCLCQHCKQQTQHPPAYLLKIGLPIDTIMYQAQGCAQCSNGYKGRIAVFEVLPMSAAINELIIRGKTSQDLLEQAKQDGMRTLYQDGLEKVQLGETSLEEVLRVTLEHSYA